MRILLVVLCLVAAGLYVKILLPSDYEVPGLAAVENMLLDKDTSGATADGQLREVPASQMQVIRDVFAPELATSR